MKEIRVSEVEKIYAERTLQAIQNCIQRELKIVQKRKGAILEERKYFTDYFAELKDDEKKDLLDIEAMDTQSYARSIAYLAKLSKQAKEPFFAGFDFMPEDEDGTPIRCCLSIQTLREPESGEMLTFDWRAPISSLYYESEPGPASFEAPDGVVSGELFCKRRYYFKDGILQKCTEISMPSDDEMLSEALSRHAGDRMHAIVETIQKEQHRIIREHIEGITVISGCAGSGKSSVALHKAAYILYGFREKMKDCNLAIISPNDTFSEYISTVLPDLGEENMKTLLPEDVIYESLVGIEQFPFMTRLEEAERIGEFGLGVQGDEQALALCRTAKSQEGFRKIVLQYVDFLRKNIFKAEPLSLTTDLEGTVSPEFLHDLFYSICSETPLLQRTTEMAQYIYGRYDVRKEENKEFIQQSLDGMMKAVSAPALYRLMYKDVDFQKETGFDFSVLSLYDNMFEDACAVSVLNLLLHEPIIPGTVFYLICDEAQDFSPIFLELLRHRYSGCDMLFVGDRDQIVFENSGDFAEDIKRILTRRPLRKYELKTNYRSTKEIVSFAAGVLGRDPGEYGSVRSGAAPKVCSDDLETVLEEMQEAGMESVCVLTRTREEARKLAVDYPVPMRIASVMRVRFLPVYLAKGLEFDGVVVWNSNDPYYQTEKGRFALYTACTRAMHRLVLIQ
ncbi:MAG: ATP-binding domain-containing protein [Clostridia bacterium]|nr:ATP-binding domain-containing protein [Clostridia bacterium]